MEGKLNSLVILLLLLSSGNIVDGFIGIYWGRYSTQSLIPSMVVDLFLQNGVYDIRLSAPSPNVLQALQSSNLSVTVALGNDFIKRPKWSNIKTVDHWVQELLVPPIQRGVNITTLVILEEPYSLLEGRFPIENATDVLRETVFSLKKHNLTHIRTTTAHFSDMLKNLNKPSEADFVDESKDKMVESLILMNETNSFFMYHMYPIYSAWINNWPIEFAFMDNRSNFTIVDGEYTYTNAFEFMFDALVVAIEKAGFPDMEIVIGEVGWPTDGGEHATVEDAERFYRSFLPYLAQKKGTPRRPNKAIDVFLAGLTDENKCPLIMGPIQRHRGIYNNDGTPKFKIDFSGKGGEFYPTSAKGMVRMPSRWCIFNGDTSNMTKVEEQMKIACNISDCTALSPGSSCGNLNFTWNVSYAFNMFYQTTNQELPNGACGFEGLGAITPVDPSVGTCQFPVEILTAEKVDNGVQVLDYIGYGKSSGNHHKCYTLQDLPIALPLVITLFALRKQFGLMIN